MTSSIMHSCDESDDFLRITSVEVEVEEGAGQNVPTFWSKRTHTKTYPPKRTYQHIPKFWSKHILSIYVKNHAL